MALTMSQIDAIRMQAVIDYLGTYPTWKVAVEPHQTKAHIFQDGQEWQLGFSHQKANPGTFEYEKLLSALNKSMAHFLALPVEERRKHAA
jgi:hypothetical protein